MFEYGKKEPIKLLGFNNLQKAITFNIYDFTIAINEDEKKSYIKYINTHYNSQKIAELLRKIASQIGATVMDESKVNFDPYGASCLTLLGEGIDTEKVNDINMHLDKSHISAHSYPDFEYNEILSFRLDIDLSTCGNITPLIALDSIFEFFESDVVEIDYRVRGYTRNEKGKKIYRDHEVHSLTNFIDDKILEKYECKEVIIESENFWKIKMKKRVFNENEYFYPKTVATQNSKKNFMKILKNEIDSLFNGS